MHHKTTVFEVISSILAHGFSTRFPPGQRSPRLRQIGAPLSVRTHLATSQDNLECMDTTVLGEEQRAGGGGSEGRRVKGKSCMKDLDNNKPPTYHARHKTGLSTG